MAAISFEIGNVPVIITTDSASLSEIFSDYFRYYHPRPVSSVPSAHRAIHLSLMQQTPPAGAIPSSARLISQAGVVQLWHQAGDDLQPEQFYLHTAQAVFRLIPEQSLAEGLVAPQALRVPHYLTNTWALFALLLLLRWRGLYHLHAAAVLQPQGKLCLISGEQRAGKTTLATALGLAGWRPVSDDSLLIQTVDDGARLSALRKSFHLSAELLSRWPGLAAIKTQPRDHERTCAAGLEFFGTLELAASAFDRIDYVILPQITAAATSRIENVPASAAIARLAEQSIYFPIWPAHTERQMQLLAQLAGRAACCRLFAGQDILADPLNAARILENLK